MNIACQKCGGLGVADVNPGEDVQCAHCQHIGPATAAPAKRKPARGGFVVRVLGALMFAAGVIELAIGSSANSIPILLIGLGLYVIGQLEFIAANLTRLNERVP
jgi:hypothetical protein